MTRGGLPGADGGVPPAVQQKVRGQDQAQQAALGSGVQYNYFGDTGPQAGPAVSIAVPVGQRDERFPLRGRDELLAELADADAGMRGCGCYTGWAGAGRPGWRLR